VAVARAAAVGTGMVEAVTAEAGREATEAAAEEGEVGRAPRW
jgi:hypothetical protein